MGVGALVVGSSWSLLSQSQFPQTHQQFRTLQLQVPLVVVDLPPALEQQMLVAVAVAVVVSLLLPLGYFLLLYWQQVT